MANSLVKKRSSRTLAARIHKLSGQLRAIEGMVSSRRSCAEVLAQVQAVRAGLANVAAIVLNEELLRLARGRRLEPADVVRLTANFIERT